MSKTVTNSYNLYSSTTPAPTSISLLSDVNITSPINNDNLQYNTTAAKWENSQYLNIGPNWRFFQNNLGGNATYPTTALFLEFFNGSSWQVKVVFQ